ncbi:hypothetical protein BH708_02415 [Brachybacterium sp. P6-10-X1]|nr:hypothetical protein BH708_02415 [Brachybacterium sp. P6-10-X1]
MEWLNRLCGALADEIDVAVVTVVLGAPGESSAVLAANTPSHARHAETEFDVGEGPAQQAWTRRRPVLVSELDGPDGNAWPGYTMTAVAAGVRAAYAFPLQMGAARVGVLAIYHDEARGLTESDLNTCLSMAELATQRLIDASGPPAGQEIGTVPEIDPSLGWPLHVRDEVYQAQGIIAVRLRVTLTEALARIRGHAFTAGRDLIDVAADIVHAGLALNDVAHDTPGAPADDPDERNEGLS